MRNIALTIAYDGSGFSGWQRQKYRRTVQGEIEAALLRLTGRQINIDGCSRTDAGVHALGQRASFLLDDGGIPAERLPLALNDLLASDRLEGTGDIKILEAQEMPLDFHARYSAKGKRYIYRIFNAAERSPFRRTRFYQIEPELDIAAMHEAASHITGTHDFKCFETSSGTPRESTVRTVFALDITESTATGELCERAAARGDRNEAESEGRIISLSIEGDGFLYNMVRIITGTLVEVGLHKRQPSDTALIIESLDRSRAGHTAPPQGLYLYEIFY